MSDSTNAHGRDGFRYVGTWGDGDVMRGDGVNVPTWHGLVTDGDGNAWRRFVVSYNADDADAMREGLDTVYMDAGEYRDPCTGERENDGARVDRKDDGE